MRSAKQAQEVGRVELHARRALAIEPGHPEALRSLAGVARFAGESLEAVRLLRELQVGHPTETTAADICDLLFAAGREDEALAEVDRALDMFGEVFELLSLKARFVQSMRTAEDARPLIERTIELDPLRGAHYAKARMTQYTPDHPHLQQMDQILARDDISEPVRLQVSFAAAVARDQLGQHDRAFEHYAEGNRLRRAGMEFDLAAAQANVRTIREHYTEQVFSELRGVGAGDDAPVLIVGLPRSGSSLVEHVLSSHPSIFGAGETGELVKALQVGIFNALPPGFQLGERPEAVPPALWASAGSAYATGLRRRDPQAARIVDKQLFNDLLVGVVHLMLPNARIIHCRREAMDHCWSCYSANILANRAYMYDLGELGRMYQLHHAMMDHWHRVLPQDRIMALDHERMVEDPEHWTRALIDFVGLPWDDACLDPSSNQRPVRTMSAQQLREPIRGGRGGRWRPYEAHLGPLVEALAAPVDTPVD